MTTQISAKLAALGIALMMNVAMMGAIAYMFNAPTGNGQTLTGPIGRALIGLIKRSARLACYMAPTRDRTPSVKWTRTGTTTSRFIASCAIAWLL